MGRMSTALLAGLFVVVLAFACDGSDEGPTGVLQLPGGPVTEEQLRAEIRMAFEEGRAVVHTLCRASNFSDEPAVTTLTIELLDRNGASTVEPDFINNERLVEIVREECRLFEV